MIELALDASASGSAGRRSSRRSTRRWPRRVGDADRPERRREEHAPACARRARLATRARSRIAGGEVSGLGRRELARRLAFVPQAPLLPPAHARLRVRAARTHASPRRVRRTKAAHDPEAARRALDAARPRRRSRAGRSHTLSRRRATAGRARTGARTGGAAPRCSTSRRPRSTSAGSSRCSSSSPSCASGAG